MANVQAPQLSFVVTCKGRLEHLRQTLPTYADMPGTECIVVDYDCPQHTGDWVETHFPGVRLVRVRDAKYFSIARARNLGAQAALSPWLLFLDADKGVDRRNLSAFTRGINSQCFYRVSGYGSGMAGSVMCAKQAFEIAGGYDEAFQGYGGEDVEFYARLRRVGLREDTLEAACLTNIPHGDDIRTIHHAMRDKTLQWQINALYRIIKADMLAMLAMVDLPLYYRLELMERVNAHIVTEGAEAPLEIEMPDDVWNGIRLPGYRIGRKVTYRYRANEETKIFGTGLPRTGTTSLAIAMLDLGFRTCHAGFDTVAYANGDAFFDTPVYVDYPQLDADYPGAKFIHSTRDFDAWYASVERVLPEFLRKLASSDPAVPGLEVNRRCWLSVFGTFELDKERYRSGFMAHEAAVRAYFHDRPDDLLILDLVRDGDAARRLATFLGKPHHPVHLPRTNQRMATDWHLVRHPNALR